MISGNLIIENRDNKYKQKVAAMVQHLFYLMKVIQYNYWRNW